VAQPTRGSAPPWLITVLTAAKNFKAAAIEIVLFGRVYAPLHI